MDKSLRKLQLCILDIALEVRRICDEYGINYFLIGGTLLGAVRHKGFIPWDDDMDIGMLRDDYEKFISIAAREIKDPFFLQTTESDPYYGHGYAKIRICKTIFHEDYTRTSKQNNGIFLDIFPYDNMPDEKLNQKLHYVEFKLAKWALIGKSDYCFKDKKRRYFSRLASIMSFRNRKKCANWLLKVCTRYNQMQCVNSINLFGAYDYNEFVRTISIKETIILSFEGYEFRAPAGYDELLKHMYGDYMQLPPVEKRISKHKADDIDFGDYVIINAAPRGELH